MWAPVVTVQASPIVRRPGPDTMGISAVVLAAGESARMGSPKPLLEIEGRTLLARALDAVRPSGLDDVVVVLGHQAERVRRSMPMADARVVVNPAYRDGLSSSLRAGLRACRSDSEACFVILADQPFLTPETVTALANDFARAPAAILVPTFRGRRGNPVLLGRGVWPEVEALSGDLGFRALFGKHSADLRAVPVEDPGILIDVDTPEDLERIRRALEEKRPLESLV